ncbi:MAG: hypothetical protein R2735_08835 [Microthrixaceae bacterium]
MAPRTWRHHQQKKRGELPSRPSQATGEHVVLIQRNYLTLRNRPCWMCYYCRPRFVDVGVTEVYATLLDEGTYLCSESTMHRILREHGLSGQRRQSSAAGRAHETEELLHFGTRHGVVLGYLQVAGPSQRRPRFYLYAIWDLWSH